jgi:predicted Zn-dependent protease
MTKSSASSEGRGGLAAALSQLQALMSPDAARAEARAREILKSYPGQPEVLLLLAAALQRQAKTDEAIAVLRRSVRRQPQHFTAWRLLGDVYAESGKAAEAAEAYLQLVQASVHNPVLQEASKAMSANRLDQAGRTLRHYLEANPTDVTALRMLAEVAARDGRLEEAEGLLKRVLALCPGFAAARAHYAAVLNRQLKADEALVQVAILRQAEPQHPGYRVLEAAVLVRLGEMERAIAAYRALLAEQPKLPKVWLSLGHTLKTAGRQTEAVEAYRESLKLAPGLGEAWWSLANLKTFRFAVEEIAAMRAQLERQDLADGERVQLSFALGKALEDRGEYALSFGQYAKANALRRAQSDYDAAAITRNRETLQRVLTEEFFRSRAQGGCLEPDPIFIVGLPRSGSTLVEQILASHSQVEGTMELPDIFAMVGREAAGKPFYPDAIAAFTPEKRRALGEEYLARTRVHRRLGRAFFIDKMPNNFLQTGFIALILPKAKIIDVRRDAMACGFSCFKQYFARGQEFSYSLPDIGRYYADYAALMAHFDAVLPGRVHHVQYEELVRDLEGCVRRLLAYCGLGFEEACLRFFENKRIVQTASSEQVRLPVYADALQHWRHFEPWLGPLKEALENSAD